MHRHRIEFSYSLTIISVMTGKTQTAAVNFNLNSNFLSNLNDEISYFHIIQNAGIPFQAYTITLQWQLEKKNLFQPLACENGQIREIDSMYNLFTTTSINIKGSILHQMKLRAVSILNATVLWRFHFFTPVIKVQHKFGAPSSVS